MSTEPGTPSKQQDTWVDRAMISLQAVLRRCAGSQATEVSEGEADDELFTLNNHLLDDIGLSHTDILFRTSHGNADVMVPSNPGV